MSGTPTPLESLLAEREWVRSLARSLVNDPGAADDAEQETWVAAVRSPPRDAASPRAWLGTVLRNFVRRGRRGDARRGLREMAAARPESVPSAADRVARAEAHRRVVDAVLALDEPYRSTVLARFFDDVAPSEIARQAGVPVETVRTRLKRALAMLRARLDADYGGDGRSWGAALLPLTALQGGLAVKTTTKAGLVAAALLLAGAVAVSVWSVGGGETATLPETSGEVAGPAAPKRAATTAGNVEIAAGPAVAETGTSTVRGEVWSVSPEAPLAGVTVAIGPAGAARTVVTDDGGRFRLDGLPTGFRGSVRARREGTCTSSRAFPPLREGEDRDVGMLRLSLPAAADVIVFAFDGTPIAGAEVSAWRTPRLAISDPVAAEREDRDVPEPAARLETGADGRVRFEGLEPATWTFSARRTGFAASQSPSLPLRGGNVGGPVRIHLERGRPLEGRFVDRAGRGVADLLVRAEEAPADGWSVLRTALPVARTGPDGRFEFDALRNGTYELRVRRTGAPPVTAATVRVPRAGAVEIVLAGRRIVGAVRDSVTGAPVPGAVVRASAGGWSNTIEATTDAEGRYVLDTVVDTEFVNMLEASKPGWVNVPDPVRTRNPRNAPSWRLPSSGDLRVDLLLRKSARLSGRVALDGAPVRDATVVLSRIGVSPAVARTDSDGRYGFDGIERGRVLVQVFAAGLTRSDAPADAHGAFWSGGSPPGTIEMPDAGEVRHDVEMAAGVEVSGRVLDADGAPVAGASVLSALAPVATANDGTFRVRAVPRDGEVAGRAEHADKGWGVFRAKPPESGALTDVEIRLTPQERLRGRVTSAGTPAAGAWVEWTHVPTSADDEPRWAGTRRTPVGADGSFEVAVFAGAKGLLVRAGAPDHAVTTATVAPDADGSLAATLELARAVRLAGRAVVAGTGEPCPGAEVLIDPENRSTPDFRRYAPESGAVAAVAGGDGRFVVEGLAPGPALVRVQAAGFVAAECAVDLPAASEVRIEIPHGATIEGTVRAADGTPIAFATASATVPVEDARFAGGKRSQWCGRARTDVQGRFTLSCLPEGSYDVAVTPDSDEIRFGRVERTGVPTGTRDLEFVVEIERPAGSLVLRGRVVGEDGTPVFRADVTVAAENRWYGSAVTSENGSFEVPALEARDYRVHVTPPRGSPFVDVGVMRGDRWLRAHADGVRPPRDDLVITLPKGATISGVLVDASGAPLRDRWIAIGIPAGDRRRFDALPGDDTDSEGRFEITGLRPGGNVRLVDVGWPGVRDPAPLVGGEDVAPGTRGLRLTPGTFARIRGVVLDGHGVLVAGAQVHARDTKGRERSASSDATGTFEFPSLLSGDSLDVTAWTESLAPSALKAVPAGTEGLRLTLAPGLRATGRVFDAAGQPVASSRVMLRSDAHPVCVTCPTDAEGRFAAQGLAPGRFRASFQSLRDAVFTEIPCGTLVAGAEDAVLREE